VDIGKREKFRFNSGTKTTNAKQSEWHCNNISCEQNNEC